MAFRRITRLYISSFKFSAGSTCLARASSGATDRRPVHHRMVPGMMSGYIISYQVGGIYFSILIFFMLRGRGQKPSSSSVQSSARN